MVVQHTTSTELLDRSLDSFIERSRTIVSATRLADEAMLKDPAYISDEDSVTSWMGRRLRDTWMLYSVGPAFHQQWFDTYPNTYDTSRFVLDALLIGPLSEEFETQEPEPYARGTYTRRFLYDARSGIIAAGLGHVDQAERAVMPLTMVTSVYDEHGPEKARELAEPVEAEYRRIIERA